MITSKPSPHINAELLLSREHSFSYNSQIKCFRTHVDMDMFFLILVCRTRTQSLSAPFSYTMYKTENWFI
jgi:hypothetical protein